jgi:very-short-patch-repair endonuclease
VNNNLHTSKYHYAYKKDLKGKSRRMRNNMTAAERKLWYEYLRQHCYRFLKQKPIGNYIVDFYCPKLKLVIEVDGESHLDNNENIIEYDKIRTRELNKVGVNILRFWNYDVLDGFEAVCEIIEKELLKNPPTLPAGRQAPLCKGGGCKYGSN